MLGFSTRELPEEGIQPSNFDDSNFRFRYLEPCASKIRLSIVGDVRIVWGRSGETESADWLSKKEISVRKFALMLVSTVGLTVCASAAMADAAAPAPAPSAQPATSVSDLDKTVCRTLPPATGTRIGARRECRTQREWDDIRIQSQKETSKMEGTAMAPRGN